MKYMLIPVEHIMIVQNSMALQVELNQLKYSINMKINNKAIIIPNKIITPVSI